MLRTLPVCALLILLATNASAQQKPEVKETIIKMTVYPAPEPKLGLKYQLLPTLDEMNPGNPILGYLKCFSEQHNFFHNKSAVEQRQKWQEMPLKDLPVKEMRNYGAGPLTRADYAARLTTPDWETLIPLKRDGIYLLLPEVQQMRELAGALLVRFRGEVADHRFDDGIVTAKTMFSMARHFGEHPSLIGILVGYAIANIGLSPLEEMVQQPGCPNLFWAMSNLPHPLVEIRKGVQGERFMWQQQFSVLNEKRPMTEEELVKALAKGQELVDLYAGQFNKKIPKDAVKAWLEIQQKDPATVAAARKSLVEAGLPEKVVAKFPAAQVILVREKKAMEAALDDTYKAMQLPYWQADKVISDSRKKTDGSTSLLLQFSNPFTGIKVLQAQVKVEQRLALLCHIEALRMYAANNKGKLPEKLGDINLPLPLDPVNGQPFHYSLEGKTATLYGAAPRGMETSLAWNQRYVITVGEK